MGNAASSRGEWAQQGLGSHGEGLTSYCLHSAMPLDAQMECAVQIGCRSTVLVLTLDVYFDPCP